MHSPTFYQMKTNLFFIFGFMSTLCSCTSQEERCVKDFAETQELHAEAVKFDNVIKSGDIYMSDNYLILRDINPNAEYLFMSTPVRHWNTCTDSLHEGMGPTNT